MRGASRAPYSSPEVLFIGGCRSFFPFPFFFLSLAPTPTLPLCHLVPSRYRTSSGASSPLSVETGIFREIFGPPPSSSGDPAVPLTSLARTQITAQTHRRRLVFSFQKKNFPPLLFLSARSLLTTRLIRTVRPYLRARRCSQAALFQT